MFRQHVSAPRKLAMLAAAAAVALGLSACGGGGGTVTGGGPSGPSGGGGPDQTKQPRLTVRGVTVDITHAGGSASMQIHENGASWPNTPGHALDVPAGWAALTRQNSSRSHRFHAVTDIDSRADDDYLAYGHWSENPIKDLDREPEFESFFYGSQPYTGNVPSGTATATYTGGAAGIYKTGITGPWGYFESAISLEANFAAGEVTAILSDFGVLSTLSPSFSFGDVTTDAATISGGSFTHADWGGQFFGPSGAAPTGAAGWFEGLKSEENGGDGEATLYGSFAAKQ